MSEETTEERPLEGNLAFTDADVEQSSTLHSLLNDVIIAVKEEEFNREELEAEIAEGGDDPYGKEDAISAYQRVGVPLMAFATALNNAVLLSVFDGIDPEDILTEDPPCCDDCDCEASDTHPT
jgi:hypothetical protein